ncbi:hypothetical protein RB656_000532 [Salmonella enterica]|nr:hypothetical protein [Salmonella enterica]
MNKMLISFLIMTSFAVSAAPEQYKSISKLMDDYNDYSSYNVKGVEYPAFKVVAQKPLHIQISPSVYSKDPKEIKYASDKAAVYAAYRTLYQTPAESVKVTVLPLSIDLQTKKFEYLAAEKFDFSVSKKQADNLLRKYGNIRNPSQLMTESGSWSDNFNKCCYLEEGKPGLTEFAQDLISQR